MSIEKDISYVYEKIFSKAHYDALVNEYVISKEDYMYLNLSNQQLNILRKMCKYNGIKLESLDYRLPSVEDEELFKEYNEIKTKLKSKPKNKEELEQRRIAIRNKIVTDNLELVRVIIDRNFDGINEMSNKEDIYQLGYSILFDYVDGRDLLYPHIFTKYISSKLIYDLKNKLLFLDTGLTKDAKRELEKLHKAKKILSPRNSYPTPTELAQKLNIEVKRVEELLNLERVLEVISIDEEVERINDSDELADSPLYDDTFEKQLLVSTSRNLILKILNTLSEQQRDVIMLSYGFKDGRCYNDVEIANMLGVSNPRIGVIRHNALENLKLSLRSKYLRELYDLEVPEQEEPIKIRKAYELEDILIEHIPQEELNKYLQRLPKLEKTIVRLYLGLATGVKYTLEEISYVIHLSVSRTHTLKKQAYENIRNMIIEQQFKDNKNSITYEEYLNYLMETYVIHQNTKRR